VFKETRETLKETLDNLNKKFKMWPMFVEIKNLNTYLDKPINVYQLA